MALKRAVGVMVRYVFYFLSTLSADTAGQLDVLRHDGNALGVDCAQVGILEQSNQVGLGCFLKKKNKSIKIYAEGKGREK